MKTPLIEFALANRIPSQGLIIHSDQGFQLSSIMAWSISADFLFKRATGYCYDNAAMESF